MAAANDSSDNRVYIYDCTLRDGAQTQGVDFNASDKELIAEELDRLGVDYIEGGWPGANPTDDAFFAAPPKLKRSRLTAFGMTRRAGRSTDNDPGLTALLGSGTKAVCMVGKTWDFHVDVALEIDHGENIAMISDSIAHANKKVDEVLFDAEHFFDGYKENQEFALGCLKAAFDAGARWIVLCDTNGGTLPHEVERIVGEVTEHIPGENLGIHCHDDTGNAVANSLAAVRAGARQVQGALNGLGERCGNTNLISIIPSLILKMGYETGISADDLTHLTHVSRMLDEHLNRAPNRGAPYVGETAFAHKGGLHVSAVEKDPRSYEHVAPETVGNQRHIVVSDQSGRSNILARFRDIGLKVDADDPKVSELVETVKQREFNGYAYDGAEASFELLARRALGNVPDYFHGVSFRVIDERRWNAKGDLVTLSEATVRLEVNGEPFMTVAEGNGPVNALDAALRKVLVPAYPELEDLRLVDYKVRILTPGDATAAVTRVMIESADSKGHHWSTVGVSPNVIDASYNALRDSIVYKLFRDGAGES
ncbi:MAG: citramalate synthase [Rhodospirillaceae bacterium]|nr:citramalate synthase [Rhodospirillaceae bacterium]MBT4218929.1 citramalate synthase [Rhodospirillaceae bacterium]MBT4465017.1 citramalate synthase [Rhodospirillaceae bacterium]MBT5013140.1 citramalate synthase [Rhodospirillaceae bacterium]MBT5307927.1 citramalate synthase [Rhodospirillaceae bacterium]